MRAGEFVLGYPNEYGLLTDRPLVPADADPGAVLPLDAASGEHDLGRNGTYLVMRQMQQDVPGFWRFVREAAGAGDPVALAPRWSAAGRAGRRSSPAPTPTTRRTRPRTGSATRTSTRPACAARSARTCAAPTRATRSIPTRARADSIAVNRRHRLLRRGRKYGPPADVAALQAADGDG